MRLALVVGILLVGCGDNSRVCGAGTVDVDGMCVADVGPGICGDGTMLDPETGECVLADGVCGNGTVLINGQCQDPTAGLEIDLLEAAEPNGFEADATPAGIIALPEAGGPGFTIHGCVQPVDSNTADLDRYLVSVAGPTLLDITADGVQGLAAGFQVIGDSGNPLLATWQRLGISLATDMSKREVLLPAAGNYELIITDSRTLFPITEGNLSLPAAGDLEGHSCYYVTIATKTIAPQPLALATGDSGQIGTELKFYTSTFPTGFTELVATIDPGPGSRAASSIVVLNNAALHAVRDADETSPEATALFGGIVAGDQTIVVLDHVWNTAIGPVDYSITATPGVQGSSQALPVSGGTITATSRGQTFTFPGVNLFHFDVTAADAVVGVSFASSIQLQGSILDQAGNVAAELTGLDGNATSSTTFASYLGLLRTRTPGRYYFMVFAPRNPVGTAFTITSTLTPQPIPDVALGASITGPVNAFNSKAFHYDAGTEPWQVFDASGTSTGPISLQFFDDAATFGRLDALAIRTGGGAGVASTLPIACATCDVAPIYDLTFPQAGNPVGRILKDPPVTSFLVKARPTILTGTRTITVDLAAQLYTRVGTTLAVGSTTTLASQTIDATNRSRRYYLETARDAVVTVTATPTGAPATLNAELALIDTREADVRVVDASAATGPETLQLAAFNGFAALEVRGATALSVGAFTLQVRVDPAFTYAAVPSTTAFADACNGGTAVALSSTDDGLSAAAGIVAPAGFTLFGTPVTRFRVSSNGFLTFDLANTSSLPDNQALPQQAGVVNIAPYWDDLGSVAVCSKTIGAKLVVQWTGSDFLESVQFQAILDPATDSIEFVYGPNHEPDGSAASVGIQGALGVKVPGTGATKLVPQ
ncbi:MAG: hypothetical protein ABI867_34050 [Kofleriaceae bacterium]